MPKIGSTIRLYTTVRDFYGNIHNAETVQLKVYDAVGTLKGTYTLALDQVKQESEGVYYYDYIIETGPDGMWKAVWTATLDSKPDVESITFKVVQP